MLTDNFVKYRNKLHVPADDDICICGHPNNLNIIELDIADINKYKQCKVCFEDYGVIKGKSHGKAKGNSAKADKRRTPLATW